MASSFLAGGIPRLIRKRPSLVAAVSIAITLAALGVLPASGDAPPPFVTGNVRVDRLISRMTLTEKVDMINGTAEAAATNQYQAGYLPGVPRLGIPSLRLADGPPGVATKQNSVGMTQTMGVAATFSTRDARDNGVVIGRDARALGQDVTLQPFVNMDRDPTWNRAFNVFGEDPYLTGQTGAAEIAGIQGQGTLAQVKHYIAYDGANNVVVDEQTLHEIYLAPFTDAVKARVSSVMCSYNTVNVVTSIPSAKWTAPGPYACGNAQTLTGILRNELGFRGFVTSDWGANHATTFINAGLDMEMPGRAFGQVHPPTVDIPAYFTPEAIRTAVENGTVSMSRLNEAVGRVLLEYDRFGLLSGASKHSVTPEPVAADERVVERTAADAATLLKNRGGALPLTGADLRSLALIGPGAGQTMATGGGGEKSSGLADRQIGTYPVLRRMFPGANITYAVADDMTGVPVPPSALANLVRTNPNGSTQPDRQINYTRSNGNPLPAGSSYRWTGSLVVPTTGDYWLNIQSLGAWASLSVDGRSVGCTAIAFGCGPPRLAVVHPSDIAPLPTTDLLANSRTLVHLTAGAHAISVVEGADLSGAPVQVRLNWVTPAAQRANHDAAVAAARRARTAVVFAWSLGTLTTPLPDDQDRLISDIAAANPRTVVVLNTHLPVAMPWLDRVAGVLEMWFPGDTGGFATANALVGRVNPAGRLPFTWPRSIEQTVAHDPAHPERTSLGVHPDGSPCLTPPAFGQATDCVTTYSEGIFIGYRWFDQQHLTPLFPFGYGLSYSRFGYSNLAVTRASDGGLNVAFTVRNLGTTAGDEVPQVYLGAPQRPPAGAQFAVRALAAYGRVTLGPGRSTRVRLHLRPRQLQYWSTVSGWLTATGTRTVYIAASSRDIRLRADTAIR